jgi:Fe-S cluster biogenesis protein NfuA
MNKQELIERINIALDQIRPYLKDDNGDIELIELTDDLVVKVMFLGACKSCSMNSSTLKGGVEEAIKRSIPEIKAVIAIDETLNF